MDSKVLGKPRLPSISRTYEEITGCRNLWAERVYNWEVYAGYQFIVALNCGFCGIKLFIDIVEQFIDCCETVWYRIVRHKV